jgi:hypothetical protein
MAAAQKGHATSVRRTCRRQLEQGINTDIVLLLG